MSLMCTNNLYLTQNLCWLCFRWRIRKLGQYHYINFFVLFRLFFSFLHLHCMLGSWSEIDSECYRFCWPWPWPYFGCTFLLPYEVLTFLKILNESVPTTMSSYFSPTNFLCQVVLFNLRNTCTNSHHKNSLRIVFDDLIWDCPHIQKQWMFTN
jgi:hypothetical protein